MSIKKIISHEQGLSDLLNYGHLIDDGVILNKDGAFVTSYKFRGPDINSASSSELDALTANFNRMATMLDDGWMLHVDELRIPSIVYPEKGHFPDSISELIDEERRQMYESDSKHYENLQFITFVWKFPMSFVKTTRHWFVEGENIEVGDQDLSKLLKLFHDTIERCLGIIGTQFILEKLYNSDLLSYLNTCITGELLPVSVPHDGCFIDVVLGRKNISGGYVPKIGNKYIYVLSVVGYLNEETIPGLLEQMGTYPMIYRWSNRFIPLSELTAEREIKRYQKNWNNKVKGILGIVKEVISGKPSDKINFDALQMSQQTNEALMLNSNRSTRFGYWASEIVLMNENIECLNQASKELSRYLEQSGFACIQEDVNAFDAWLGTIPGHGSCNVRRVFINSNNLAHVLPLHSIWAGEAYSSPSSLLPAKSPPVFYAATTGKTPFRFHLDVSDIGHQLVLGPTGAGKSTYIDFLIAQFLRYENAQIFIFDKDNSHKALTSALGGHHYDIGNATELAFSPLADLSTESKKMRAAQFIEDLVLLQNVPITPDVRSSIYSAVSSLSDKTQIRSRNITVFRSEVQNQAVRDALKYYTIDGQIKLLDATEDCLQEGHLHTFEMNWLLQQKPEIYVPIFGHIFNSIDSILEEQNADRPTLIVIEEFAILGTHPIVKRKLKDGLKTRRKQNARIVLATQSPGDLYDPSTKNLTELTAAVMESCPTKIFLPNSAMESEISELYRKMNLSDRQIEIISQIALPKKHYYVVTPEGNRLIELGLDDLNPLALSFIGLSKKKSKELMECKEANGESWVFHWLIQCGFPGWAEYWKERNLRSFVA
jgi:type IV secretion/conjugal transfer VirB4 family ATPase